MPWRKSDSVKSILWMKCWICINLHSSINYRPYECYWWFCLLSMQNVRTSTTWIQVVCICSGDWWNEGYTIIRSSWWRRLSSFICFRWHHLSVIFVDSHSYHYLANICVIMKKKRFSAKRLATLKNRTTGYLICFSHWLCFR